MVQLWGKFLIITLVLALHNWAAGFPKSAASRIQEAHSDGYSHPFGRVVVLLLGLLLAFSRDQKDPNHWNSENLIIFPTPSPHIVPKSSWTNSEIAPLRWFNVSSPLTTSNTHLTRAIYVIYLHRYMFYIYIAMSMSPQRCNGAPVLIHIPPLHGLGGGGAGENVFCGDPPESRFMEVSPPGKFHVSQWIWDEYGILSRNAWENRDVDIASTWKQLKSRQNGSLFPIAPIRCSLITLGHRDRNLRATKSSDMDFGQMNLT